MSRVATFLLGMATGAMLLHGAMHYHLVRARDGLHLVGKTPPGLSQAFVDVRQFGAAEWTQHPQLAAALVRANKQSLMQQSAVASLQEGVNQALPAWSNQ
jgi:hypothetical protein